MVGRWCQTCLGSALDSIGESLIIIVHTPLTFWGRPADAGLVHDHHEEKAGHIKQKILIPGGVRFLAQSPCDGLTFCRQLRQMSNMFN